MGGVEKANQFAPVGQVSDFIWCSHMEVMDDVFIIIILVEECSSIKQREGSLQIPEVELNPTKHLEGLNHPPCIL